MQHNDPLTEKIIACCYTVHNALGPGFKETVYHNALKLAFDQEDLKYDKTINTRLSAYVKAFSQSI